MLCPPLRLTRNRRSAQPAPCHAVAVDADVEVEHARPHGHGPERIVRALAYGSRQMERLRTLTEAECYERCYGWRWTEDTVKVLRREPDLRLERTDAGERLRRLLELRLDAREPEAA
jgi:hypothetical protein